MKKFLAKCRYKINQWYEGYVLRDPDALLALKWISENRTRDFRHRYDLPMNALIFDCGGFEGDWAERMNRLYPTARIFVFEVVPAYVEHLRKRFQGNNQISVFDFGLGDADKTLEITIAGVGSSVFVEKSHSEQVKGRVVAFRNFMEEQNVSGIDLLKMNIEGGEYELLTSILDNGLIERCAEIQIQFHNYGPWTVEKREEIRARLAATHFLTYDFAWNFENWKRKSL